jgi:hypothetical protein
MPLKLGYLFIKTLCIIFILYCNLSVSDNFGKGSAVRERLRGEGVIGSRKIEKMLFLIWNVEPRSQTVSLMLERSYEDR